MARCLLLSPACRTVKRTFSVSPFIVPCKTDHEKMTQDKKTNPPWLVAVWPGMGHVAISAGYYLMSKLGMRCFEEFPSGGVFDVDFALVKSGIIQKTHRPRSRFFIWKAPEGKRDIIVFIGEAQPPQGKFEFCEKLIDFARDRGVERLFTFAAMAT